MKGRILYLADANSIHIQRWANHFAERGWEVGLVTYSKPPRGALDERVRSFPVFHIPKLEGFVEGLNLRKRVKQVRKITDEFKPDVTHAVHTSKWGVYADLADVRPRVLTEWGLWVTLSEEERVKMIPESRPASQKERERWKNAVINADALHADSQYLAGKMENAFGCASGNVAVIPWGVDLERFTPKLDTSPLRERLDIGDAPLVVSTRTLDPVYDVETLVRAIPLVLKQVPEAKFLIKGRGKQEDMLKALANELGVSGSTTFVGFVDYGEMPLYTAVGDVYVSTSLSDTGSVSLQEALACGRPVVVSDAPSNDEWVEDSNGRMFERGDVEGLASALIELLNDEQLRKGMSARSREIAEEKADQDKCMGRLEEMYLGLMEK